MTPEEFKQKFKVGDLVVSDIFYGHIFITSIGEKYFLGKIKNDTELVYDQGDDWIKAESKPIPKKPSEEIKNKIKERVDHWYIDANMICFLEWLDENWEKKQDKV